MNLKDMIRSEVGRYGDYSDRAIRALGRCTCGTCRYRDDARSDPGLGFCDRNTLDCVEYPEDHGCYAWRSK